MRIDVEILPMFKGFNEKLKAEVASSVGSVGKDLDKVTQSVGTSTEKMAKHTSGLFSSMKTNALNLFTALAPMAAGFGALAFIKDSIKAATDAQKLSKQTEAVIASTGASAHVTSKQIADYATQLSLQTGIEDDVIQANENLLLTFTGVRNEVGKGNDIFAQANRVVLDMSVALGEDGKSAAIQLGKALQDPINGVTALRRVGVNFTDAQKDQIKALVDTGNTMGAQKIILAELNKEFGGSAIAQATASDKMKAAWEEVKEEIGGKLLPIVSMFASYITNTLLPGFMTLIAQASRGQGVFGQIRDIFVSVWSVVRPLVVELINLQKSWYSIEVTIIGGILPALRTVGEWISSHGTLVRTVAVGIFAVIAAYKIWIVVTKAYAVVQAALNAIMAANPIGIIILAVVALAAAFAYAYTHSKAFRDIIDNIGRTVVTVAKDIASFFVVLYDKVKPALEVIGNTALWMWNHAIKPVLGFMREHWNLFLILFLPGVGLMVAAIRLIIANWEHIKPVLITVGEAALWMWNNAIKPVFEFIKEHWKLVLLVLLPGVGLIIMNWDHLKDAALFLWNNVLKPTWEGMKILWSGLVVVFSATGGVIEAVFRGIAAVALWLWQNILYPAWTGIRLIIEIVAVAISIAVKIIEAEFRVVATVALWLWQNVLYPAWTGIRLIIEIVSVAIQIAIKIIEGVFKGLAIVALWLWQNILYPAWTGIRLIIEIVAVAISIAIKIIEGVFQGFAIIALWLWHNVIEPAWNGIKFAIAVAIAGITIIIDGLVKFWKTVLEPAVMWLWHNIIEPAWNGIRIAIQAAWDWIRDKILNPMIKFWHEILAPAVMWLWHSAIEPAWNGIQTAIQNVWNFIRDKIFGPLVDFVSKTIPDRFRDAVHMIEGWWNLLKHIAAAPISFIIDTVINKGIVGSVNAIAGFFHVGGVDQVTNPLRGLAAGGKIPGVPSEQDNTLIWAATGEHVMPAKRTNKWLPTLESIRLYDKLPEIADAFPRFFSGGRVGASMFGGPSDPGTGHIGYRGDDLRGKSAYAELDMGTAMGGLAYRQPLLIGYNNRSVIAQKLDIGRGGGPVAGIHRAIDLWYETARALGFPGLGIVNVSTNTSGGAQGGASIGGDMGAIIANVADWIRKRVPIGDIANKFSNEHFVRTAIGAPVRLLNDTIHWAEGLVKRLITDPGSFLGSAIRGAFGVTMQGKLLGGAAPGFPPWPSSPGASRGDSGVWRSIVNLIRSTGPISGTFGNAYRAGDPLWHGSGRAVDWMGYNQDRLAQFFMDRRSSVLELIHRTNSHNYAVTRGVNKGSFDNALMEAHRNHIHVAMDNGYGVLRPGANVVENNTGRSEVITSRELVELLKQLIVAVENVAPGVGHEIAGVGRRLHQTARIT